MKILLVLPISRSRSGAPNTVARPFGRGSSLSLAQLAAVTPPGHELTLVEEYHQPVPRDETFDLVGLSINSANVLSAYALAAHFRARGAQVVAGGIHASVCPDEVAEHVSAVVVGEGEEVWPLVLQDAARGAPARRYRAERPVPLDDLPPPRRDLLALRDYSRPPLGLFVSIAATRGCPYDCAFCSVHSVFGRGFRRKNVDRVLEDVEAAREAARGLGPMHLWFVDDTLDADPSHAKELFDRLHSRRIRFVAMVTMRAADDEELLRLAARAGCQGVLVGLESLDGEMLEGMGKSMNLRRDYGRCLAAFRRHGLRVQTSMIFGFPRDTPATFETAVDFMIEKRVDVGYVNPLFPFPGTALHGQFQKEGRLLAERFWLQDVLNPFALHRLDHMSPTEYEEAYWRALQRLCSVGAIGRRLLRPPRLSHLVPALVMNGIMRAQVRDRRVALT